MRGLMPISLTRRFVYVLVLVAALLGVTTVLSLANAAARAHAAAVANRFNQANGDGQTLENAVIDQETGVRGYLLSGNKTFLQPYDSGRQQERRLLPLLGADLAGYTVLQGELVRAETSAQLWRADAATPELTLMGRGDTSAAIAIEARGIGKDHFDEVRAEMATLQTGIDRAFVVANNKSGSLRDSLTRLLFVSLALSLLIISLLVLLQWRWVLKPLQRIRDASRAVSRGGLDVTVPAVGPLELAALGGDVERMRARVVAEIRLAQGTNAELHRAQDELSERSETLRQLNAQLERANGAVLKNSHDFEAANAQLVAANLELEQFSYSVSHDLRAPLRAIVGFTRILTDEYAGSLDREALRYLGIVCDGARRMDVLINDLLAFSRVKRSSMNRVEVPVGELVRSLWPEVTASSETRCTLAVSSPEVVRADPVLLRQVLANLLLNAVKFSAGREPATISVECGPDPAATGETCVTVRDNGIGFDPKYADQMFEVFQRLQRADEFEGTGIGLSIVKRIVERHGGRVWATGKPGEGAAVSFTLGPLSLTGDVRRRAVEPTEAGRPDTIDVRGPAEDAVPRVAAPDRPPGERTDRVDMTPVLAGSGAIRASTIGVRAVTGARLLIVEDDPADLRAGPARLQTQQHDQPHRHGSRWSRSVGVSVRDRPVREPARPSRTESGAA